MGRICISLLERALPLPKSFAGNSGDWLKPDISTIQFMEFVMELEKRCD